MESSRQNFLGIDWGSSKIGVALAHAETRTALAYATLPNDAALLPALRAIAAKEAVGTVIVGTPKRRPDQSGSHPTERFGQELGSFLEVPVFYADEMFTSQLAQELLNMRGEKDSSHHDDAEAAKILLQDWLDRESSR